MESKQVEVKSHHDMWERPGMNVERFEKTRCVPGDVYRSTFLSRKKRPQRMDYFTWIVPEITFVQTMSIFCSKENCAARRS